MVKVMVLRPFSHHRMLEQLVAIVVMHSVDMRQLLALVLAMVMMIVMIMEITTTAEKIILAVMVMALVMVMVMVMMVVGVLVGVFLSINIIHLHSVHFQLQVIIHQLYFMTNIYYYIIQFFADHQCNILRYCWLE